MMRRLSAVLTAGLLMIAAPLSAEDSPVVVELFTSQGCSSCPPADEFLRELARRDDVIALALHVDYWDYIGWKDIFGKAAFTRRQQAYANSGGRRSVYTPQMIVNGMDHVVGTHPKDVEALIKRHAAQSQQVSLNLSRKGGTLTVNARATQRDVDPVVVQLIRYRPNETVQIKRGENAGRTIVYANVVTEWRVLKEWDGVKPLSLKVPVAGQDPLVVIVQQQGHGPIEAAAQLR